MNYSEMEALVIEMDALLRDLATRVAILEGGAVPSSE